MRLVHHLHQNHNQSDSGFKLSCVVSKLVYSNRNFWMVRFKFDQQIIVNKNSNSFSIKIICKIPVISVLVSYSKLENFLLYQQFQHFLDCIIMLRRISGLSYRQLFSIDSSSPNKRGKSERTKWRNYCISSEINTASA